MRNTQPHRRLSMNRNRLLLRVKIPIIVFGFLLLTLFTKPLMAQSQPLYGTAVDSSGAVVPGATVKITDLGKSEVVRTATTDENGRFRELDIQPGRYQVSVAKAGFKTTGVNFTVDVNRELALGDIKMDVGQVTETVSVSEI